MVVHVTSMAFNGVETVPVDVQAQISLSIPAFTIVGLADKTIAESRERVKAALSSIGQALPAKKILINLAPADLVKEGSHFDLPIACAILASLNSLPKEELTEYIILGELSLDGTILPISGVLPAAIGANSRNKGFICGKVNGPEAAWSGNNKILAPTNLLELINHFKGEKILPAPIVPSAILTKNNLDFQDIIGQKIAKRALEIAASGGHNLLMTGPPGVGKSILAARLPSVLPPLTNNEILECSTIASVAGQLKDGILINARPFRAPHHSCSMAAMVGGGIGRKVKPGEISLAHNGVLFLDELPEFPQNVIESLRQPIETGEILISRAGAHIKFPANFQLIAAMNPCKCGYLDDVSKSCSRAPKCGNDYQAKISGPIMDRFDLNIEVAASEAFNNFNYNIVESVKTGVKSDYDLIEQVKSNNFVGIKSFNYKSSEESSENIRLRVAKARLLQEKRFEGYGIQINNRLDGQLLIEHAFPVDEDGKKLLNDAANKFKLSMRTYNKILRVARTIADLDESTNVYKIHISEALSYRLVEFRNFNYS